MPNLTCVWRRLLWHNAVIFILTEAAVQLCRSLLVCIFKSVLIHFDFSFWSDVHLMLAVISQHVMLDQMMITEMYRRFWTHVNFEKRIFFFTRPKTHPSGGWGQNQKHFSWWMTCQDFMAWWQDGFSKNLSTPDSLKARKKERDCFDHGGACHILQCQLLSLCDQIYFWELYFPTEFGLRIYGERVEGFSDRCVYFLIRAFLLFPFSGYMTSRSSLVARWWNGCVQWNWERYL